MCSSWPMAFGRVGCQRYPSDKSRDSLTDCDAALDSRLCGIGWTLKHIAAFSTSELTAIGMQSHLDTDVHLHNEAQLNPCSGRLLQMPICPHLSVTDARYLGLGQISLSCSRTSLQPMHCTQPRRPWLAACAAGHPSSACKLMHLIAKLGEAGVQIVGVQAWTAVDPMPTNGKYHFLSLPAPGNMSFVLEADMCVLCKKGSCCMMSLVSQWHRWKSTCQQIMVVQCMVGRCMLTL